MMPKLFKPLSLRWLVVALAALTLLSLAFQGGEVDPAHCGACFTPTLSPTPRPTDTPVPPLQPCQVDQVLINGQTDSIVEVEAGTSLNLRLRVINALGQPLTGAKVEATVTQSAPSAQSVMTPLEVLDDMAGYYDSLYSLGDMSGDYTFKFEVSDLNGSRFLPCSAERTVRVNVPPTATPTVTVSPTPTETLTPTPTITVTPTPTETLTPTPTVTVTPMSEPEIKVILPAQTIDLCGSDPDITSTITISNVTNLTGVQLEASYDPTYIQVIDAFRRPRPPVQVKPAPVFDPFIRNEVDTSRGKIYFMAEALTPVTGESSVIFIDWRLQGRTGSTAINVAAILTDASGEHQVIQTAPLTIIINSTCFQGTAALQGRTDYSGVRVSSSTGEQTQTYPNGLFAIASTGHLDFTFPGYLPVQVNSPVAGQTANLPAITLLAGDVNGDKTVNILDLASLAGQYLTADSAADLNADGQVDILDLALAAGNYGRSEISAAGQ